MYTCLWVPPALIFLFSTWFFLVNLRGFIIGLRYTIFPARHLSLMLIFLALAVVGFVGLVWLIDLMAYRNANPAPIQMPGDTTRLISWYCEL